MKGTIEAATLHRMAYNGLLMSNKSAMAKGSVLWILAPGELRIVSTDDFAVITDTGDTTGGHEGWGTWMSTQAELKDLEKELRGEEAEEFDLSRVFSTPTYDISPGEGKDVLGWADDLVTDSVTAKLAQHRVFAAHPDRFRKLSLVKPGGYPIDFQVVQGETDDQSPPSPVLAYRVGPTVKGIISTLNRSVLEKKYSGEELWR